MNFTVQKRLQVGNKSPSKIELLDDIIRLLAAGKKLHPKNKDYPLTGDWIGFLFIESKIMFLS